VLHEKLSVCDRSRPESSLPAPCDPREQSAALEAPQRSAAAFVFIALLELSVWCIVGVC
jgi:hypothetical protein